MLACILQKRLCLLASLLSVSAWAHPWPPHLLVGQGYGHCPDGYHGLPMEHARLPTLLPQLQALPPGTYGLSDGKYLSQPQGGTLVTATADEAASLPRNLCLAWGPYDRP